MLQAEEGTKGAETHSDTQKNSFSCRSVRYQKNTYSCVHKQDTQLKCNSVAWLSPGLAVSASQNTVNTPQHSSPALTGLLECRKRDESRLIKNLITGTHTHRHQSLNTVCLQYSSYTTYMPEFLYPDADFKKLKCQLKYFHVCQKTDISFSSNPKHSLVQMSQLFKVLPYHLKTVSCNYRCQRQYNSLQTPND